MARKLEFMFNDDNPYHAATKFIDESCLQNHFAAGLNGANGKAFAFLLDALIRGELDGLKDDPEVKTQWENCKFKMENFGPGEIACIMAGRGFGYAKTTKLPQTQSKTVLKTDEMLKLKRLLWKKAFNGTDVYHVNAGETREVETKKEETKQEKITKPKATQKPKQTKVTRKRSSKSSNKQKTQSAATAI